MKKNGIGKWILRIAAAIVIILIAIVTVKWKDIKEIAEILKYAGLFEPEHMAENFRSMQNLYPYKTVHRSGEVYRLSYEKEPLPGEFEYEGRNSSIPEWIERTDTTGLIILHNDKVVFEEYYKGYDEHSHEISMSVSKSVISFLLGTAVESGAIKNLSDPVDSYVSELRGSGYEGVSVKDVLQMSSGIRFTEDYQDLKSDFVRMIAAFTTGSLNAFIASLQNEKKPGTYNKYISANTQVLGMVLAGATGKSVTQYTEEKLWSKLGAESDAYWLTDPNGTELTLGGFCPVLRDLARFGLLYLHEGLNFQGERLISADWVHASITPDAPHLMPGKNNPMSFEPFGYGYHWWIPEKPMNDYLAIGIYGQFIYVHPPSGTVIVKTSAYRDYDGTVFDLENECVAAFQAIAKSFSERD